MTADSFFAVTCTAFMGMLLGSTLAFSGYRLFIFLLPLWGFFTGFGVGAQAIQAIFGTAFLSDVTSWIAGFFLGLLFALLSYLFFAAAVAILAGSVGYVLGSGVMAALGFDMGLLTWLVGTAVAVALIMAVFVFDVYKWVIILATSLVGAGVVVGT